MKSRNFVSFIFKLVKRTRHEEEHAFSAVCQSQAAISFNHAIKFYECHNKNDIFQLQQQFY